MLTLGIAPRTLCSPPPRSLCVVVALPLLTLSATDGLAGGGDGFRLLGRDSLTYIESCATWWTSSTSWPA